MLDKRIAIEFDNVGKMYRLGRVGTGTLSHDLNRWWTMNVLRKEDPYLKIGQTNDRTTKGESDYVWALKDISFKVEQGEVLGIIGKNGAGKSTLLKLLSNITSPTTGSIRYKGRIASLLEVGTGFHPEMTGRENIYMNGNIMGMTKAEITRKLDEIVDFAGVERYLDTPVKRYSSGMTVRLGFAVAAFLEPEILVVDEVLTVGDAEFQKKAIGKMDSVAKEGGRTVLFVSHNMDSIRNLCVNCVWLENGMFKEQGPSRQVVDHYIENNAIGEQNVYLPDNKMRKNSNEGIKIIDFKVLNNIPKTGEKLEFEYVILNESGREKNVELAVNFKTTGEAPLVQYFSKDMGISIRLKKGINKILLVKNDFPLVVGDYLVTLWVGSNNTYIDWIPNCMIMHMENGTYNNVVNENRGYPLIGKSDWIVNYI